MTLDEALSEVAESVEKWNTSENNKALARRLAEGVRQLRADLEEAETRNRVLRRQLSSEQDRTGQGAML